MTAELTAGDIQPAELVIFAMSAAVVAVAIAAYLVSRYVRQKERGLRGMKGEFALLAVAVVLVGLVVHLGYQM